MATNEKDEEKGSGSDGGKDAPQQTSANTDRSRDSQSDRDKELDDKVDDKNETQSRDPVVAGEVAGNGLSPAEQLKNQQDSQVSGSPDPTTCTPDNPSGSPTQQGAQIGPWDGKVGAESSMPPGQVMEVIAAAPFVFTAAAIAQEALGAAYVGYEILSKTYEYIRDTVENQRRDAQRK